MSSSLINPCALAITSISENRHFPISASQRRDIITNRAFPALLVVGAIFACLDGAYPLPCRRSDVIVNISAKVPGGHQSIVFADQQSGRFVRCHEEERPKTGRFRISGGNMGFRRDRIKLIGGGHEEIPVQEILGGGNVLL